MHEISELFRNFMISKFPTTPGRPNGAPTQDTHQVGSLLPRLKPPKPDSPNGLDMTCAGHEMLPFTKLRKCPTILTPETLKQPQILEIMWKTPTKKRDMGKTIMRPQLCSCNMPSGQKFGTIFRVKLPIPTTCLKYETLKLFRPSRPSWLA